MRQCRASAAAKVECVIIPDSILSRDEKMNRQMETSLEDIEKNNEIIRGLNRLSAERKLEQVWRECEKLQHSEYYPQIWDYLQQELNVTFNLKSEDVRYKELGDIIFYYLLRGRNLNEHVRLIIIRLYASLSFNSDRYEHYSWYELCCLMLHHEKTFTQVYKRLDNDNITALQYFLYKQPQLLLNKMSYHLRSIFNYLPSDNQRQIITNIRRENGQTCMFYVLPKEMYSNLYFHHADELYKLLSVRDSNGQTALHVNGYQIGNFLAISFTPKHFNDLYKLLSIQDENRQTCLFNGSHPEIEMFVEHPDDLYKLLSIQDASGQTALHVNGYEIWRFLATSFTQKHFNDLYKLLSIQDEKRQTCLFNDTGLEVEMFVEHADDLYKLLSIQDASGQTALHVNGYGIGRFLARSFTPKHFNDLYKLLSIQDEKGQTCLFDDTGLEVEMFVEHANDLYKLLSIRDSNGQTALHVNTPCIAELLAEIYIPKQRDAFIKLTSLTDNNRKTALQAVQASNDLFIDKLTSLISQVENNDYVINKPKILIIYNDKNRSLAAEEAYKIYRAFQSRLPHRVVLLEKNKTEEQIIELIKNMFGSFGLHSPNSLIVILMSHGSVGTIDDCQGKPIKLSEIEGAMCSANLDIPKMLITQCCQNTAQEPDEKLVAYAPTHDHFCAVMSCVSGQEATRGIFLGKLAEEITNSKNSTSIMKMVTDVSKVMEVEGRKQTPIIMSTLKADFCPRNVWWYSKNDIYMATDTDMPICST